MVVMMLSHFFLTIMAIAVVMTGLAGRLVVFVMAVAGLGFLLMIMAMILVFCMTMAVFIFVLPAGAKIFMAVNEAVVKILDCASAGTRFLFGRLALPPGTTASPSCGSSRSCQRMEQRSGP